MSTLFATQMISTQSSHNLPISNPLTIHKQSRFKSRFFFHPLLHAAAQGDINQISSSVKPLINIHDNHGNTPLHFAVRNGHLECVQHLIQLGACVDKMNKKGETPLLQACQSPNDERYQIVRLLIESQASPSIPNIDEEYPLHHAIANRNPKIVEFLLQNGAPINACDSEGETVLFWAIRYGWADVLPLLFQYQADINVANSDKETPLHFSSCVGEFECVKRLVEFGKNIQGFDINSLDDDDSTPLQHALDNLNHKIADFLQKHGASSKIKKIRYE